MEQETKTVPFKWQLGEEKISLEVNSYLHGGGIHIGMTCHPEDGPEPFADMTVNIPGYSFEPNEAFINGDIDKDALNFIKENKLGKVLPFTVQSGYGKYAAVAFDLDKLKEFDPKGIAEFKAEHGIPENKPKKKSRGMER